jgi:hypothetical protein
MGGDQRWLIAGGPNRGAALANCEICRQSFSSRHFQNASEVASSGQMTKLRGNKQRGNSGETGRRRQTGHTMAKGKLQADARLPTHRK